MAINPLGINQGTNAFLNFDLSGTVNTQIVNIGTINGNIPGGTLGSVSGVGVITSLTNGSINIPNGTLQALGTLGTVGLVNTVTTVSNITNGSIHVTAGTDVITSGSIAVIAGTEIITSGSISVIAGTIASVGTIGTLGLGTITGNLGTMGTVGTVASVGSITNLGQVYNAGTLQGGTINTGTISLLPLPGSVLTTAVNIGTTAGTAAIPTTALSNRKALIAYNVGTSIVYIGGTGVSLTTGIPIGTASYTPSFDLGSGALYAIAATPGGTLIALEIS